MRSWKQRLCSLLLCGAMLASLCPTALAEDVSIPYLDETGTEKSCERYIAVTPTGIGWNTDKNPSGWYVAENSAKIEYPVTVRGTVHLILANGCDLKVIGGIEVREGSSLTIYAQSDGEAMGKLEATNRSIGYAAIGGGNITINGGTVTANGERAAGIGGDGFGDDGGTITINGGKVTATSVDGAGIGGGSEGGNGGNITINGGTVTATSKNGAGIGGGSDGGSGTIAINGGTVTATSSNGAGIGGGNGGTVTATSSNGAGIGGGNGDAGGQITISGGTVTATSEDYGAGIGGGRDGAGGTITINGGKVGARSYQGAGIGGGEGSDGGKITIKDGTVTATSIRTGAGIGGGFGGGGGEITISGGTVEATGGAEGVAGGDGAGIGGGFGGGGGTITISGGTVTATSKGKGADIGGGGNSAGGGIAPSEKIEIGEGANVKGSGGGKPNLGPPHGAETDKWASDSTGHWHPCEAADCAEQFDKTAHSFGDWTIDTPATTTAGSKYRVCGECQYREDQTIPPVHSHSYEDEWKSDASGHWHECSCGDKSDEAAHSFGDWTIDTPATTTPGSRHRVCGDCQYREEQTIPPVHSHSYGDEWKSDADRHWHECSCGSKSGYAPHAPGPAATCTEPQTCTKCGYVLEPASGHTPGPAATCTEPQFCTVCGQEMAPALGHSFGEKVPQKDATAMSTGMKAHYLCSRCGNYFDEDKNPTTAEALTIPKKAGGGSYIPPTYPPTVKRPGEGGGAAAVSPSRPERGDTVTVTPKPDEGYAVDKITVTDPNGEPVAVTAKPDGTYTFKQPAGKVKIEVTYKPAERPWSNPFADVSEGDWYYEAARYVQENGLMNGYSDGRFGTDDTLSRAQLAQILFNKEGRPVVNYLLQYGDVSTDTWYAESVRWATSQGIVGGYGDGTFGPNDPITREQLAVMLWRYSGSPAATSKELYFSDTDEISSFALEALRWAVENGILNGGSGRLAPQEQATRAQAAQMLKNFIEHQEEDI